jgi:hypothetical protein
MKQQRAGFTWLAGLVAIFALLLLLASPASATTPTTPTIDGTINTSTEWATDENMGASGGDSPTRDLYVTWDSTNLYVGVTDTSSGSVDIYMDVVTGGQQEGLGPATFPIAGGTGGYEYLWRINNAGTASWSVGTGSAWTTGTPLPTGSNSARSTDLEVQIPWNGIGGIPDELRILVLSGANPGAPTRYWPNATGNTITPSPNFTQAFIFEDAGADGVSPNPGPAPTAVTLQTTSIANGTPLALLAVVVGLLGATAVVVTRRRTR